MGAHRLDLAQVKGKKRGELRLGPMGQLGLVEVMAGMAEGPSVGE